MTKASLFHNSGALFFTRYKKYVYISYIVSSLFSYLGRLKALVISFICSSLMPSGSKPMHLELM